MKYHLHDLAPRMGKKVASGGRVYWQPRDVAGATSALVAWLADEPPGDGVCEIKGPMTPSIALALTAAARDRYQPAIWDPNYNNDTVIIPQLQPSGRGRGLNYRLTDGPDFTLVEFTIPGNFITAADLPKVVPPAVNPSKGVIISGKGVVWLPATLGLAYKNHPWVAVREENHSDAIVCINFSGRRPVGSLISENDVVPACIAARSPQRGEIWFYQIPGVKRKLPRVRPGNGDKRNGGVEDEVGPHPGIVISRNTRNAKSDDVILVPLTSNVDLYERNPNVVRLQGGHFGLEKPSIVLCHKINTVPIEFLSGDVIGTVDESVLDAISQHLLYAIGKFGQMTGEEPYRTERSFTSDVALGEEGFAEVAPLFTEPFLTQTVAPDLPAGSPGFGSVIVTAGCPLRGRDPRHS